MDDGVLPAYKTPPNPSAWSRDWLTFEEYRQVHERYMEVLRREALILDDTLAFRQITERGMVIQVALEGTITATDDVLLEVTKFMDTRENFGRLEVISTYYRYHALRPGRAGEPLLRYDQSHGFPHYHRFTRDGGTELYEVLTLDQMPRLDAVVREAEALARERDGGVA